VTVVVVRSTTDVADGIRAVELAEPDGQPLTGFGPGDHVDLHLADGLRRSYSLVGDPGVDSDVYRIAVALTDGSRGGSKAVHALVVGEELSVSGPVAGFRLAPQAGHTVLIAGGIGITPIVSMARALQQCGASWELHYAARSRSAAAFLTELQTLADSGKGQIHASFSDEDGPHPLDVSGLVAGRHHVADTHWYCCGPASLLDDFLRATRSLYPGNVHVERFNGTDLDVTGDGFEVELARTGVVLTIDEHTTVLDAVLDEGVDVDFSCMEGMCGSCRTAVLSGVPNHRDAVLTAEERDSNEVMMICCSRTGSGRLVLDL
jgi:ferredoxin-NADP reductase